MRDLALATDYDGTIAARGQVDEPTIAALERYRAAGRRLILVTGRELDELKGVCHRLDLFDRVVAENGGLLYRPGDGSEQALADRPPMSFVTALEACGVRPISVGRTIVATWQPHAGAVLDAIRATGLDLQVILNKRAVMVLPTGVNKATALAELGLDPADVVAVGDAENDEAFLAHCGFGAAVANAVPSLEERAKLVTRGDHGAGVAELIDGLLAGCFRDALPTVASEPAPG
jgi:HAD superfamily hydrolase (TIGR01484 family)